MEGTFKGISNNVLFYRKLTPKEKPKAIVILVHGHGDHSGGLQNLSSALVENGYSVYALDLRGHGKSTGKRGFISTWEEYRGDLNEFLRLTVSENQGLPLYLSGHSLGGVIALDYVIHHRENLSGLITISPAISYEATLYEKLLISFMGKLKPDYTIEKAGDIHGLTSDQEIIKRLEADDLRHDIVTPGLGRGLMGAVATIEKKAGTIILPYLLQFGIEDQITPLGKLRGFFHTVGSENKKIIEYPSLKHRPFDDIGREAFLADLIGWLDQQIV